MTTGALSIKMHKFGTAGEFFAYLLNLQMGGKKHRPPYV